MATKCKAYKCNRTIHPAFLMCRTHWFKVPIDIRRAIWQTVPQPGKPISEAYIANVRAAIAAVKSIEYPDQPQRFVYTTGIVQLAGKAVEKITATMTPQAYRSRLDVWSKVWHESGTQYQFEYFDRASQSTDDKGSTNADN